MRHGLTDAPSPDPWPVDLVDRALAVAAVELELRQEDVWRKAGDGPRMAFARRSLCVRQLIRTHRLDEEAVS